MKKHIAYILLFAILCSFVPQISFASSAEYDMPALIYLDKDFEAQTIGDMAYGFYYPSSKNVEFFSVQQAAKPDDADNKALKITGTSTSGVRLRHPWSHCGITKNFVIKFAVNVADTKSAKSIYLYTDVTQSRSTYYLDQLGGSFPLMVLTDVLKVNGTQVPNIKFNANQWYTLEFDMDMDAGSIGVYVDGKKYGNNIPMPSLINIAEFTILAPAEGVEYYIDDISIYENDGIMDDAEYEKELADWLASPLCPDEKYEVGRLYRYDKFVYRTLYNTFLGYIGSNKVYKDNVMHKMPGPILEDGDKLIAPVRGIGEVFGANVTWDGANNKFILKYNGKTMEAVVDDDIYYVDGKPAKLYYPTKNINGSLYMQLDVLTHFFGEDYKRVGQIVNFGRDIVYDRDFGPMIKNQQGRTWEEEMNMHIERFLVYDRPTKEEILEIYKANNPEGRHPRIYLKDFSYIKEGMEADPQFASLINTLIKRADSLIETGPVEYSTTDGQRGSFPQKLYNIGNYCGLAYILTGDTKYKDFIWQNMEVINTTFPDFRPQEGLDIGNSANGMAPMYDWLYNEWTPEQRKIFEENILEKIIAECEYSFASAYYNSQTAFAANSGNGPLIVNNGYIACAIALMDVYPERCAALLENCLRGIERSYLTFAPDGGFPEGLSYWLYTCDTLPYTLANLDTNFGRDFFFSDVPGLNETIYYALSTSGATGGYPLGDAAVQSPYHGMFMWHANKQNDKSVAQLRKENMSSASLIDVLYWVFDTEGTDSGLNNIEGDSFFTKINTLSMRTGWSGGDTSVIFHGGGNGDPHGHLDIGSFQFDMLGVRWADELPKEDYVLREYGAWHADDKVEGHPYGALDYYRNKGEGHNTVIAGLGTARYDMPKAAKAPIIKHSFGETLSYGIMNLTESNPNYECAVRGVQLDKVQNQVIVQDNFKANSPMEFLWSMHTTADIELSEDGKSAILTKNNKRIWASIISDGDENFQVLDAKPMKEYEIDGISFPPPLESGNDGTGSANHSTSEKYQKLAVINPSTDHFKLTVAFKPLVGDETVPSLIPEDVPMEQWMPVESERAQLMSVSVDGAEMAAFNPEVYNYDLQVITEKSEVPEVSVVADDRYEVELIESSTVPGVTTATLKEDGNIVGLYNFTITPLNDTTKFLNDKQIPIVGYTVTSEPQPENGAANLFDANFDTKFATDEDGGAVTVDFGSVQYVKEIMMRFQNGTGRQEYFKVEYSVDGITYNECYNGASTGTTKDYQSTAIGKDARYLRISFYGNNKGAMWVSVSDFCAFTE